MVVTVDAGRPRLPEPATDELVPLNTLTNGVGATPVNDAECVLCDRLTTWPGDICLCNGATVVSGMDNCSAAGAASHFSTTTTYTFSKHQLRVKLNCTMVTRKPCYRKDDRTMRPIYGCPEKFWESVAMPTATFPEIVNGLLL